MFRVGPVITRALPSLVDRPRSRKKSIGARAWLAGQEPVRAGAGLTREKAIRARPRLIGKCSLIWVGSVGRGNVSIIHGRNDSIDGRNHGVRRWNNCIGGRKGGSS